MRSRTASAKDHGGRIGQMGVYLRPDFKISDSNSGQRRCIATPNAQLRQKARIRKRRASNSMRRTRPRSDHSEISRNRHHGIDPPNGRKRYNLLAVLLRVCNYGPASTGSITGHRLPVFRPEEAHGRQRMRIIAKNRSLRRFRCVFVLTGTRRLYVFRTGFHLP